jgi:hypothetical protein
MAALVICTVTAARLRRRTGTRAPAPHRPDQPPASQPGQNPTAPPRPPGCLPIRPVPSQRMGNLALRQALSAWYHQRTRLA